MCGRYSLFTPIAELEVTLGAKASPLLDWRGMYNATPTMQMPIITNEFPGIIQFFRWGLVPKWAKSISIGSKMTNTRTESILEKPAFMNIFKYRRCLVLADGYYEWQASGSSKVPKTPFRIYAPKNEILLMAGLWDTWQGELNSFSIITCPPNADLAAIHNRMPVVLNADDAKLWLSSEVPATELLKLLQPAPEGWLLHHPISMAVNKASFNEASIITPALAQQTTLL